MRTLPDILNDERLLDRRQQAEFLGISQSTVDRLGTRGELPPAIQISDRRKGRSVGALRQYVKSRQTEAA